MQWRNGRVMVAAFWVMMALVWPRTALADMGPKPSMAFTLEYHISPSTAVIGGELLECSTADCADAVPLQAAGPQQFSCDGDTCSSLAYGYQPFHRLRLQFADGTVRESNVFGKKYFAASYRVVVEPDRLEVTEERGKSNPMGWVLFGGIAGSCLMAILAGAVLVVLLALGLKARQTRVTFDSAKGWLLAIWVLGVLFVGVGGFFAPQIPLTVAVELVLAGGYAAWRKQSAGRVVSVALLANIITLPGLMLAVGAAGSNLYPVVLMIAELIVWGVEAAIIRAILRPDFTWRHAMLMSLLLNGGSLLAGLLLPF